MRAKLGLIAAFLLLLLGSATAGADLKTLFTTPQERQIINANRYHSDQLNSGPIEPESPQIDLQIQQLVTEEVTKAYKITGITVSSDGTHVVWINSHAYEDGEMLDDNSKIKVLAGDDIRVRITAPDGKSYFAVSGETLQVTYVVPVE